MTRVSRPFFASVVTVVGIIVCVAAASCAAPFAVNDVFGQPLVCGEWYDVSVRVATFLLYIAADTARGTLSSARCSYATVSTTVTTTTTAPTAATCVFAGSLTTYLSNDGQFDCTGSVCRATTDAAGKRTQEDGL
jgi:hypothetical protein